MERPTPSQESPIKPDEVGKIFEQRPELVEEMKKVLSIDLKLAFEDDYESRNAHPHNIGPWYVMGLSREGRKRFSKEELEGRSWAEANLPCFKGRELLSLVFSSDEDAVSKGFSSMNPFSAPRDVRFHGAHIARLGTPKPLELDQDIFAKALKTIDKKKADCLGAITEIERLGKEFDIDSGEIEILKEAVIDFATYIKPEPKTDHEQFCEVGRCFTVPGMFRDFCKTFSDLKVGTAEYHREVHGHSQFYHQVNLLDGKMVVDWTAKQYRQFDKEAYPFVYRVGDERVNGWGPLT